MITKTVYGFIIFLVCILFLFSCSVEQQIGKKAKINLINNNDLSHAHIGISLFDPGSNKFLYNYQGDHFFVPASNTKIFTCYAALKYLGDSLTGIRYIEDDTAVYIFPTADPSLLHKDFPNQPVIVFLQSIRKSIYISEEFWKTTAFGNGWAWNDYNDSYMPERSPLPVYGNTIRWTQERTADENKDSLAFDKSLSIYSLPEVNWKVRFNTELSKKSFFVQRSKNENIFEITEGTENKKEQEVPFVTNGLQTAIELLKDTIYREIIIEPLMITGKQIDARRVKTVFSQPTDSVLKIMMHRSDNFFAEQILLMAANEKYGSIEEDSLMNTILKEVLNDFAYKPRWADGSGLSRYNIFSPQHFIALLHAMKKEFPENRLKAIFPTAGEGTLGSYPKSDSGYIYAKTGTLSGVVALSGFLYTRKNKLLIFSILINNHRISAAGVRKHIVSFLSSVRNAH